MKKNLECQNKASKKLRERGLTLTALVVTIIILLILATITIRAITGDNGIIRKTSEAVNTYKIAESEEQKTLEYLYGELNPNAEITISLEQLNDIIDKRIQENSKEEKLKAWPIGSIYISANNTSPEELFGGTWEKYGQGRTLIGEGTSDKTFVAGETGGESEHTLTVEEMPSHRHSFTRAPLYTSEFSAAPGHGVFSAGAVGYLYAEGAPVQAYTAEVGGLQAHNNLGPYIVTYMWKRVS